MDPVIGEEEDLSLKKDELPLFAPSLWANIVMLSVTLLIIYVAHKWLQKKTKDCYQEIEISPEAHERRLATLKRIREEQQKAMEEASKKEVEDKKLREEKKRADALKRMEKYGSGGEKLGAAGAAGEGYLPLSGGASTSSYRPPKRSACAKGGCGK